MPKIIALDFRHIFDILRTPIQLVWKNFRVSGFSLKGGGTVAGEFPSIDDALPEEEGGPNARLGFSYQDEIAVGFLLDMLKDPSLVEVRCETHDDVVLIRDFDAPSGRIAEFVQVKGAEPDGLWSIAGLCRQKTSGRHGTSIIETSFSRDRFQEQSRFRLVTIRQVSRELKVLTYPLSESARDPNNGQFQELKTRMNYRFPNLQSEKGNGVDYWLENCFWDVRDSEQEVRKDNELKLFKLSSLAGQLLLLDQVETLLDELRAKAKAAGDARWVWGKEKKVITRDQISVWWFKCLEEYRAGPNAKSGSRLRKKMGDAGLDEAMIALAIELRCDYSASARTPLYMDSGEGKRLQRMVKSKINSLQSRRASGQLPLNDVAFHTICQDEMDTLDRNLQGGPEDRSAFLKGCMYDIADRCLLKFAGSNP